MKTVEIFIQALHSIWDLLPDAIGPDWEWLLPQIGRILAAIQRSEDEEERLLLVDELLALFRPYPAAWRLLRQAMEQVRKERGTTYRAEKKSPWPPLPTLFDLFKSLEALLPKGLLEIEERAANGDEEDFSVQYQPMRIDAAVPAQVLIDEPFFLAVSVRQLTSALLAEADLPVVHSGEAEVIFEDPDSPVRLRLRVSAPDCDLDGPDTRPFRLRYGADSPVFPFLLTPRKVGVISIIVQLFQEEDWLGGARLKTEALAAVTAGALAVHVVSEPLAGVDPELKRQVEAKEAQLQVASKALSALELELARLVPGLAQAEVKNAIAEKQALINGLERDIDLLMSPSV